MRKKLVVLGFAVAVVYGSFWLGNDVILSQQFYLAILAGVPPVAICTWIIIRSRTADKRFLLRLFFGALLLRYALAYIVYSRGLQNFLGGDASTYDFFGNALMRSWVGLVDPNSLWLVRLTGANTSGWGMYYLVAAVYYLIGQNPFAIQLINCALGAGACVAAYKLTMLVYPNERVARLAGVMTAFSPSLVLWTSQGLKDGPIMLCLCLCALYALKLRSRLNVKDFLLLLASLLALYTLRHYAAYIMLMAIAGALLFTMSNRFTPIRMIQGAILVIIIGVAFSYFGAKEVAERSIDLKKIQIAREWGAKASNSGFGGDVDISDPQAALEYLPLGVLYVLLAPFPWMISNMRQLITLPELIVWWILMPIMAKGFWFAVRKRLRESFAICTFVIGLTLAFALYQSNAGTAYRHRSQLYPFFFVFICIGLDLRRNEKLARLNRLPFAGSMSGRRAPAIVRPLAGNTIRIQTHER
ncbi:MAG TPA: glycosyltransferase family 39 protein [Blastocatellia bacterium]|nr:glycosyltransferase family 39 protein [Blastocatellia bacterium]